MDGVSDCAVVGVAGGGVVRVEHLGRISYARGLEIQHARHAEVLGWRDGGDARAPVGVVLVLEHDPPVITVSRRQGVLGHLVATEERLARSGVEVCETDRGGDITYHGPGQVVVYPILDLNRLGLGLHAYMRMLEDVVMGVCAGYGVACWREDGVTGVWAGDRASGGGKIAAMGIRVRRWVSLHGLALNVATDLSHFDLIVPCGLAGRRVTSLARELGAACPSVGTVGDGLAEGLARAIAARVT
jgi:lipoyl(octanoyl) transferase